MGTLSYSEGYDSLESEADESTNTANCATKDYTCNVCSKYVPAGLSHYHHSKLKFDNRKMQEAVLKQKPLGTKLGRPFKNEMV